MPYGYVNGSPLNGRDLLGLEADGPPSTLEQLSSKNSTGHSSSRGASCDSGDSWGLIKGFFQRWNRGGLVNALFGGAQTQGGVYTIRDPLTNEVMKTGRTKDLARRQREYARDPATRDYDFRVEAETNDYLTQRGLEQELYDMYPDAPLTYLSCSARPPTPRRNN